VVDAAGLVSQPHPESPGLRFDGAHLHAQQPGGGGYQAALHDDGEHYDHGDDAVETLGIGYVGLEQQDAQQDRHGALQPGEQDEVALVALQPGRDQRQSDQCGPDDEGEHGSEDDSRDPYVRSGYHGEVDGEAEGDEGDDFGEIGQRGVEPLDLALVGGTPVTERDPGGEDRQEA